MAAYADGYAEGDEHTSTARATGRVARRASRGSDRVAVPGDQPLEVSEGSIRVRRPDPDSVRGDRRRDLAVLHAILRPPQASGVAELPDATLEPVGLRRQDEQLEPRPDVAHPDLARAKPLSDGVGEGKQARVVWGRKEENWGRHRVHELGGCQQKRTDELGVGQPL